jgi:hypothetical protein
MIKVWTNAAKAELLVKPPQSIVHQPHPPVAGNLIDRKWRMPRAEAGMASLFDVSLRPSEPTDQEISKVMFSTRDPASGPWVPKGHLAGPADKRRRPSARNLPRQSRNKRRVPALS